jgi:hypothetical protein
MKSKNALGYAVMPPCPDAKSLEAQIAEINAYAESNNTSIAGWVIESSKGKSELKKIIDGVDSRTRDVGTLIVADVKVIASNYRELFYYKYAFKKVGLDLDFITQGKFDWAENDMVEELISYLETKGIFDSPTKSTRTKDLNEPRFGKPGFSIFGYTRASDKMIIDEKESEVVKFIFAERNKGSKLMKIRQALSEKNIKTRRGHDFATSSILFILRDQKIYEGYIQNKLGEWVKGNHPAILEEV